jgi:hypothetical protein
LLAGFLLPNFNWLSHQSQFANLKTANLHFHLQQIIQNALKKEERKQVNVGRQAFVEILTLKFIAKQNTNPTYLSATVPKNSFLNFNYKYQKQARGCHAC